MKDTMIKGTGNSRSLRSVPNFLSLYPSYEAFAQALVEGTLPVDLGRLNPAGVEVQGTDLSKANLLTDTTAALYGLGLDATPDDVLKEIQALMEDIYDAIPYNQISNRVYEWFATSGSWSQPSDMVGNYIFVVAIGGGGGGGGAGSNSGSSGGGGGGGSGYISMGYVKVEKGKSYSYTVGAGGTAGAALSAGGRGGTTTFLGLSAAGGYGGSNGTISSGSMGRGGNGGNGGAGGAGGFSGASGTARGVPGRGGNGYGSNGSSGTAQGFGGAGGNGYPMGNYPQFLYPIILTLDDTHFYGGTGGRSTAQNQNSNATGGIMGGIAAGSGGTGGMPQRVPGEAGRDGVLYIFYQKKVL